MLIGSAPPAPRRPTPPAPASRSRAWIVPVAAGVTFALWWLWDRSPRRERRNPLPRDPVRAYRSFHWGRNPDRVRRVRVPRRPRRLVKLGDLDAITYAARKGNEDADYIHRFGKRGRGRPELAYDPDDRKLHIIGGKYSVEDRGIVG